MKPGDLVRTADPARVAGHDVHWWWCDRIGVVVREAIPDRTSGQQCWHVMIDNRTANLREEHLELLNETK